jgi:hypothetical protein
MHDKQQYEQQVEDLELKDEQAEEVKGGYSFGVSQTYKPTESLDEGPEERLSANLRQGYSGNHNETLVRI